ncbi:MAG: DegT/DnrJ/EryC1/StrS family aminotransferase, partial [Candidatus Magasanikbacteria bacterium]
KEEKACNRLKFYPARYPNSLAKILLNQLPRLTEMNEHRQEIANIYDKLLDNTKMKKPKITKDNIFLRYTILVNNPEKIIKIAKQHKIILGNWYDSVIAPKDKDVDMLRTGYINSSCPNAEKLAQTTVNLPTNKSITFVQAKMIAELINTNL